MNLGRSGHGPLLMLIHSATYSSALSDTQRRLFYDNEARRLHVINFSYDFDARHNICTGTDGYLCEIWYDELGRITASKDASGTQHVTYNELNQVTSRTDREGNTTEFEYDAAGNKSKIT